MATVGLTESMLTLMYAIAIGLSIGARTVARRIGEHNRMERRGQQFRRWPRFDRSTVLPHRRPLAPKLLSIMGANA